MKSQREFRTFALDELRLIDGAAGTTPKIRGHAAVFNSLSEDLGGFREVVAPGAFASAISTDDVRALFNHDPNYVLGRNRAKPTPTMSLTEDPTGLMMDCDPPDTQWARDLMTSIKRGDISQMSFAFTTLDDGWERKDGVRIRTLRKVRLYDVSPVTYPAYAATDVGVRGVNTEARSIAEILEAGERALVDPEAYKIELDGLRRRLQMAEAGL
jgi:uncharacterized protein